MSETIWGMIYKHLKTKGFEVYSPTIKKGECTSKYIVVKDDGQSNLNGISSNVQYYSLMLYVPASQYSKLEKFKIDVKAAMKELNPVVKYADSETTSYYDDTNKSHMVSIMYKNYRKC